MSRVGKRVNLLAVGADAKTVKGQSKGYLTGILYLSPHKLSGRNFCPNASPGCIKACLNTAGRGQFTSAQEARLRKSKLFSECPDAFAAWLRQDIGALVRKSAREGYTPAVRLNGTSDLPWENLGVIQAFPDVQFYDYTKSFARMSAYLSGALPSNYHLTFSRSETNNSECLRVLQAGGTVAIVFDAKYHPPTGYYEPLPTVWNGFPVLDADKTDLRFLDAKGHIVGLRAKGKAKKDCSGFVVPLIQIE